jgi:hypothetical protein
VGVDAQATNVANSTRRKKQRRKIYLFFIAIPPFCKAGIIKSYLPSPLGDCVVMMKKGRHSRESGNPVAIFFKI